MARLSPHRPSFLPLALLALGAQSGALAGDLNPPPGAIAPTMKPLDAIEPRICVNELPASPDAAHTITQTGRYYLVADIIAAPGQHGLLVDADDVTIDLNGYSIIGGPGTQDGVHVVAGADRRFGIGIDEPSSPLGIASSGIRGFDGDGVHAAGVSSFSLTGVSLENNIGDGAEVTIACNENKDTPVILRTVTSQHNGGHGVLVHNTLVGAGVRGGLGDIYCSGKIDCGAMAVCMNGLDGIHAENINSLRVDGSLIIGNGGDGIDASVAAADATEGFVDIAYSRSNNNGGHGVSVAAAINGAGNKSKDKKYGRSVTACGNGLDGFHTVDFVGVTYEQCESAGNGGVGFYKVTQPGQPQYGNITFSQCRATNNALQGAQVLLPADASFSVNVLGSEFNANGVVLQSAGFEIGSSGGVANPALQSAFVALIDGGGASQNSGDGYLLKAKHDAMMATIQNCRAFANERSGIDIGSDDGAGVQFDVAVRFCDLFCSNNGLDGARIAGTASVEDSTFESNAGVGMAISGFPGTGAAHCRNVATNRNGGDGLSVSGALGGDISQCRANGNGGAGLSVGGGGIPGADPSSGLKIDECFASYNTIGIAVSGENFVLRCGGSHNSFANLALDPLVFAGPSVASPAWTEVKPYTWP